MLKNHELIIGAQQFAIQAHKELYRPNKAHEPYSHHLKEVATLVQISGGTAEEIATAWLHDSVEDTTVTLEDIRRLFGEEVARTVQGLTDPKWMGGIPTFQRKLLQAEHIARENNSVKRVKLADQISNLLSVAIDPPILWNKETHNDYVAGAKHIAENCRGISNLLDQLFTDAYESARHRKEAFDSGMILEKHV